MRASLFCCIYIMTPKYKAAAVMASLTFVGLTAYALQHHFKLKKESKTTSTVTYTTTTTTTTTTPSTSSTVTTVTQTTVTTDTTTTTITTTTPLSDYEQQFSLQQQVVAADYAAAGLYLALDDKTVALYSGTANFSGAAYEPKRIAATEAQSLAAGIMSIDVNSQNTLAVMHKNQEDTSAGFLYNIAPLTLKTNFNSNEFGLSITDVAHAPELPAQSNILVVTTAATGNGAGECLRVFADNVAGVTNSSQEIQTLPDWRPAIPDKNSQNGFLIVSSCNAVDIVKTKNHGYYIATAFASEGYQKKPPGWATWKLNISTAEIEYADLVFLDGFGGTLSAKTIENVQWLCLDATDKDTCYMLASGVLYEQPPLQTFFALFTVVNLPLNPTLGPNLNSKQLWSAKKDVEDNSNTETHFAFSPNAKNAVEAFEFATYTTEELIVYQLANNHITTIQTRTIHNNNKGVVDMFWVDDEAILLVLEDRVIRVSI